MRRLTLIALTITCLALGIFAFFSQQYRNSAMQSERVPHSAASAVSTASPLEPPLVEASYRAAAPIVQFRQPSAELLQSNRPTIYLAFDQPMDRESVRLALSTEPPLPLITTWVGNTLYIESPWSLPSATEIQFTLSTVAQSQAGVPLAAPYRWRHQSGVTAQTPTLNTDSTLISLAFDGAVVPSAFAIEPPLLTTHRWITATGAAGPNRLEIIPQEPLWPETDYRIVFVEPLRATTGAGVDLAAPTFHTPSLVASYSPTGYGANIPSVNPWTTVTVAFQPSYSAQIDRAATAATLQISPPLRGTGTWQDAMFVFTPDAGYLSPRTNYTVSLSPVVKNQANESVFFEPISWQFMTEHLTIWADFGAGSKVQSVAADGERTVHLQRNPNIFPPDMYQMTNSSPAMNEPLVGEIPPVVDLALYPLTNVQIEEILAKSEIASNFQFVSPELHFELPVPVARWTAPLWPPSVDLSSPSSSLGYTSGSSRITTAIPPTVAPGAYLLRIETGYVNDQLLVLVTDHAIVMKQERDEVLLWVDKLPGTKVASVPLAIFGAQGKPLVTATTDAAGFLRAPLAATEEPYYVVAYQPSAEDERGEIVALTGSTANWRSPDALWPQWKDARGQLPKHTLYLYTDRPIYRPGQRVYMKGIVRIDDDAVLDLPPLQTPVTLRVRDARNNVVRTFDLDTNQFGTFHEELLLAEGAMLGTYQLEAEIKGELHSVSFAVEAYHKPDYTVSIAVDAPVLSTGAPITITVMGRHLNGRPLVGGAVTVRHFLLGPSYRYGNTLDSGEWYNILQDEQGFTDEGGQLQILSHVGDDTPVSFGLNGYHGWIVEAELRDQAGQSASAYTPIERTIAAPQATMALAATSALPNELLDLHLQTKNSLGGPNPYGDLHLEIQSLHANHQNDGSGLPPNDAVAGLSNASMKSDRNGELHLPLRFVDPGFYQLRLTNYDAKGYSINPALTQLLVYDPAEAWQERPDGFLWIESPPGIFAPDEAVPLQIYSSFSAPALLTMERGTVRRTVAIR